MNGRISSEQVLKKVRTLNSLFSDGGIMAEFEKVATLENNFEAQLLESILMEREIPHRMRSYHDTAFDGLFQTQKGWGYVSAPEEYLSEIREIVEAIRQNDGVTEEEIS